MPVGEGGSDVEITVGMHTDMDVSSTDSEPLQVCIDSLSRWASLERCIEHRPRCGTRNAESDRWIHTPEMTVKNNHASYMLMPIDVGENWSHTCIYALTADDCIGSAATPGSCRAQVQTPFDCFTCDDYHSSCY